MKNHSTETALTRVKNDILMNMNKGHVTLLVPDLSAAFNTVDNSSLLWSLQTRFRVSGKVPEWFASTKMRDYRILKYQINYGDILILS